MFCKYSNWQQNYEIFAKYPRPVTTKYNFQQVLEIPETSLGEECIWQILPSKLHTLYNAGREDITVEVV